MHPTSIGTGGDTTATRRKRATACRAFLPARQRACHALHRNTPLEQPSCRSRHRHRADGASCLPRPFCRLRTVTCRSCCHRRRRHDQHRREGIRLVGIDAPESFRSRCENELVLGLEASNVCESWSTTARYASGVLARTATAARWRPSSPGTSTWARHCCAKGMHYPTSLAGRQSLRASRHGADRWPRCRTRCVKAPLAGCGVLGCERHDPCRLVRRQPG